MESVSKPQVPALPEGVVALFSCAEGQQALQHDALRHGVFFHHVLQGWRGDADGDRDEQVTLDEVIAYAKSRTATYARVQLAARQTPRQKGYYDGNWILRARLAPQSFTNTIGMRFRRIPAGEFPMGSTPGKIAEVVKFDPKWKKAYSDDEQPQHRVRITRPYYLGVHEVTRGQFAEFVRDTGRVTEAERDGEGGHGWSETARRFEGRNPRYTWRSTGFAYADDHPVVNVTWNDATAFCEWLSRKEGRPYRLPTEAEWEYACRAGSETMFHHGDDAEGLARFANVADATAKERFPTSIAIAARDGYVFTAPVGRYRANAFGLHDMHGNVWEWCADWHSDEYYATSPRDDPTGPMQGSRRVHRGGSWVLSAWDCRSANRYAVVPSHRHANLGFRVALSPTGR